ncbi:unnamed protein product [Allacma fusca]|uniref:Uncharacterized protein n=1 Tax=Allacma fusca TaxID=39272 RepID=A0A8J2KNI0_9HEXA|nr:unnamed protein product [Allacma fusca]
MERWERPSPSRNCAYNINLRIGEAKFNREKLRMDKEIKSMEKMYRQNVRKVNAAQRGVVSMLGHDPYPDCEKDHLLFEHNQPGFCYRRNGQPRRFVSLLESKTRKIVHDLEGKEGLLRTPATNIISDSPVMAEILSAPDIVEILCDLRTTAVLISDPALFAQFSSTLMNSPNNPLPLKGENPRECLMHYRTNLIQEFFESLKIQMEIKRYAGMSNDPSMSNYLRSKKSSISSPADDSIKPNMTTKEWGEAVIERLRQAKLQEDQLVPNKRGTSASLDPFLPFAITINPEDNLSNNDLENDSCTSFGVPQNTVTQLTAVQTVMDLSASPKISERQGSWSRIPARSKAKRDEFAGFVKSLVTEVEKIAEIGKHMGQLQKRKQQYDTVTNPLVRLLRKKSLFSSLNEDDLLFYEYDGGRRDAEHKMARDLNMNQPRPGGFTFRVPSRTDTAALDNMDYRSRPTSGEVDSGSVSHNLATPVKTKSYEPCTVCNSTCFMQKSLKRLCCQACNAKLREKCNEAQLRDRRDKAATEATSWKTPGLSKGWPKNSSKDTKPHHLLSSIPLALRKNYATYSSSQNYNSEIESPGESPFLIGSSSPLHKGQPTPEIRRKHLLPEITKFMSGRLEASPTQLSFPSGSDIGTGQKISNVRSLQDSLKDPSSSGFLHDPIPDSWTLKVNRMDIMKLRHELETASVEEKLAHFEKVFLDTKDVVT